MKDWPVCNLCLKLPAVLLRITGGGDAPTCYGCWMEHVKHDVAASWITETEVESE